MRWLVRLFMLLLLGLMLVLGALVFLALQDTPLVARAAVLTPAHIERAKRLLERNDPRNMRPGVLRTITISEQDLDLAANYLASQYARAARPT